MKRICFLVLSLIVFATPFSTLGERDVGEIPFEDSKAWLDFVKKNSAEIEKNKETQGCSDLEIVKQLVNLDVIKILKNHQLYKHSNSILNRSLHDLPTFTWTCVDNDCLTIAVLPFYNEDRKMFFTKDSPFIKSYLNLSSPALIDDLTEAIGELFVMPVGSILSLFKKVKFEERRIGLYFRAGSNYGPLTFQFSVPFLYLERNFFLTPEEEEAIAENSFIRDLSTGTNKTEARAFLTPHLVTDKIGFGDMRLHALYTPYDDGKDRFTIGGFVTLPTAFSVKEGIIGSSFCQKNRPPPFELGNIIRVKLNCAGFKEKSKQIAVFNQITDLALGVIDHLSANLETGLGNNGHVTIGPLLEYKHQFNQCWSVTTQANVQYVTPCNKIRGFIRRIPPEAFNRDFNDPAKAEENLLFIQNTIIDRAFLLPLTVKVQPGAIVQANSYLTYNYGCLNASIGYDIWCQTKEKFKTIECPHPQIEISRALNPAGVQNKIFGSVVGVIPYGHDAGLVQFGLRGDYTFASSGMGRDFTIALDIEFLY